MRDYKPPRRLRCPALVSQLRALRDAARGASTDRGVRAGTREVRALREDAAAEVERKAADAIGHASEGKLELSIFGRRALFESRIRFRSAVGGA